MAAVEAHWGEGMLVPINAPSMRNDKAFRQSFPHRLKRAACSCPGVSRALFRADFEGEVRHLLPSNPGADPEILHREGEPTIPVACGHDMAQKIPGAKYVELPGSDHLLQALNQEVLDRLLDEVEEFVTGVRHGQPDRLLATVMFTGYGALHRARSRDGRLEMARAAQ